MYVLYYNIGLFYTTNESFVSSKLMEMESAVRRKGIYAGKGVASVTPDEDGEVGKVTIQPVTNFEGLTGGRFGLPFWAQTGKDIALDWPVIRNGKD